MTLSVARLRIGTTPSIAIAGAGGTRNAGSHPQRQPWLRPFSGATLATKALTAAALTFTAVVAFTQTWSSRDITQRQRRSGGQRQRFHRDDDHEFLASSAHSKHELSAHSKKLVPSFDDDDGGQQIKPQKLRRRQSHKNHEKGHAIHSRKGSNSRAENQRESTMSELAATLAHRMENSYVQLTRLFSCIAL
jgi:hypothetical protein